jgi:hypothetical protein
MQTIPQKPVSYYARFQGQEGVAVRDAHNAVWFLGDDHSKILLANCDAAALLLFGKCDLADSGWLNDENHNGLVAICTSRQN